MADPISNLTTGLPVAVGQIDRELKKLWEQGENVATRASLMNFAIYREGADSLRANNALISQFTENHACRVILIAHEPAAAKQGVEAWISAHCHLSRAGAKQVCCEQVSFLLRGDASELIPNIVFAHLDSDLPLYFWWQGELPSKIDEQLWNWVDRLFFDSAKWKNPRAQLALVQDSLAARFPRLTLRDLNWTRFLPLREAIAQVFDHPANLAFLSRVEEVTVQFSRGHGLTARLLIGWLCGQLGWKFERKTGAQLAFKTDGDVAILVDLTEAPGAAIGDCVLRSGDSTFRVFQPSDSDFLHTEISLPDGHEYHRLSPPQREADLDLLNLELMRGSPHAIYLRALASAESFLD
jgi:glucose-6-phosphate dehydrogenase assembly protein OpcA